MLDNKKSVVIALGYFDCLHLGHVTVLEKARKVAKQLNAEAVAFTFDGDLRSAVNGKKQGSVYTLEERKNLLSSLGIEIVYCAPVTQEFLSLSKEEFLDLLNEEYNVLAYCCGFDYRFGNKGLGDVEFLKEYATKNRQDVYLLPPYELEGQKVSTSVIKTFLQEGNVKKANAFLGRNYFLSGEVFRDRKIGAKIGFPTVNIKISPDKYPLKSGVYSGRVRIDDKEYKTVINYGHRPTFGLEDKLCEAHIIDYNGDLYGKILTLEFTDFIRDIRKFSSALELKEQLIVDVEKVRAND